MGVGFAVVGPSCPGKRSLVVRLQAQFLSRYLLAHVLPVRATGSGLGHYQRLERSTREHGGQFCCCVDFAV